MNPLIRLTIFIFALCCLIIFACGADDEAEEERSKNLKAECIAQCWNQYNTDETQCSQTALPCFDLCEDYKGSCNDDCDDQYEEDSDEWTQCNEECTVNWGECATDCNDTYETCIAKAEDHVDTCQDVCEDTY